MLHSQRGGNTSAWLLDGESDLEARDERGRRAGGNEARVDCNHHIDLTEQMV